MPEATTSTPLSSQTASDHTAWGDQLETALCPHCDWLYLLPPGSTARQCPHCFAANLTPLEESDSPSAPFNHPPELFLPFTVSEATVNQRVRQFAANIWFAPTDLTPSNLQDRLQRLYLPLWLVDTQVVATWQAEAGFDYKVVSHRDSFDEQAGGWTSQQIEETRIRWEPRLGKLTRPYHNIPAPALEEHETLSHQLGDYPLVKGQTYQPQAISNTAIRLPNRSPVDAWSDALPALQRTAAAECQQAVAADHIREFRWSATYNEQNWTLFLLPLYATYYVDDAEQPQPILIHGQTGQLTGPARASMKRAWRTAWIILAVAAVLFTLSLIAGLASLLLPPLFIVAVLGLFAAIVIAALAVLPLAIAWNYNRAQK